MDSDSTRIVRPWGRFGNRYEVGAWGFRYYCLAWIVSVLGVLCLAAHALHVGPDTPWITLFLLALAITAYFTWQTTRHGRKLAD